MFRKNQIVGYEITVSPKNNLIYLKKAFFEQFTHKIEIYMCKDYAGELIVKELDEGEIRQRYYSKSLISEIVRNFNDKKTMYFAFFKDKEMQAWRGILLPKLSDSILWQDLYVDYSEVENSIDFSVEPILYKMRQKYSFLIEWDELKNYYLLGIEIVKKNYSYIKKENDYVIYMCVLALVKEYARVQRRCKICESRLSLNQRVNKESNCCYDVFWGQTEGNFARIEIEEFKNGLSRIEKLVLNILQNEDNWETRYIGTFMGNIIVRVRESLKKKAYEYYGNDLIKEYKHSIR